MILSNKQIVKGLIRLRGCACTFVVQKPWKTEIRARLVPWNWFKPSSKIFYWPFQGGTSFVELLCFFLSCVCYAFLCFCLFLACGHLLGKGWPLRSCLWCITVSLSLSHWYPGSGVVLDCIDSWSLHPYLLFLRRHPDEDKIVCLFLLESHKS